MKKIVSFFIIVIILAFFIYAQSNISTDTVTFNETEFDFGTIKQSGGIVSHDFVFTYNGEDPVVVTGTPTSCACTSAKISVKELRKGDKEVLTVSFDPNLHEEPEGKFFKTATILTEPKLERQPEVKIWVEIDLDLGKDAYKLKEHIDDEEHDDGDAHESGQEYHSLKPEELKAMLVNKNFFLLDVHIPEQEHIPGTDEFIDYTKLKENKDKLPKDKDAEIVVYCRSGSMSKAASFDLVEMGYTNVYDLSGGINAFNELSSN